jgi:hypothetical protein
MTPLQESQILHITIVVILFFEECTVYVYVKFVGYNIEVPKKLCLLLLTYSKQCFIYDVYRVPAYQIPLVY